MGGSGTIVGSLTLGSGGTLSPGLSPGRLTIGSNVVLASGSNLALELGGTTAGSQYDQLSIGGSLTLGGATLNVALVNGFSLSVGQTFYVLDRTGTDVSLTGAFANAPSNIYTDALGNRFLVNYAAANPADANGLLNDVSLTVLPVVPEPGTWTLLGLGAAGLGLLALRRRRAGQN